MSLILFKRGEFQAVASLRVEENDEAKNNFVNAAGLEQGLTLIIDTESHLAAQASVEEIGQGFWVGAYSQVNSQIVE